MYTGFGLFALLAILVSVMFYEDLVGPKTAGAGGYYAGGAAGAPKDAGDAAKAGGPAIELPSDAEAPRLTVAVSYRKLLEVTHFHLFTIPVFLLIIAHLFMLTGLSTRAKSLWIVAGWLSSLLHLLAPWLIRYGSASLAPLFPISGGLMALSLTVMTAYPIVVMWTRPEGK